MQKIRLSISILGLGVIAFMAACNDDPKHPGYEYMPDMYRSPSYETYSDNPNFGDSMSARVPVKGTIPRDADYSLYPYPNTPEGYEAAGKDLKSPLEKSQVNLDEGKRLYTNYCVHCHGGEGKGDGSIVANGKFPPPPSYSGPLKDLVEGKMFHTITYGKNLMGAHASQVNQTERWKIIMYIQTLQKLDGTQAADSTKSAEAPKEVEKTKKA
jgi:mono/diheme cytochrome c family protein